MNGYFKKITKTINNINEQTPNSILYVINKLFDTTLHGKSF